MPVSRRWKYSRIAGFFVAFALLSPGTARARDFLTVAISPDGGHTASLETDASGPGGETVRSLVIRDTANGQAVTVAMPCGVLPECAPGGPAWSPDGTHLAFPLRDPGTHARSIYTVALDGSDLVKVAAFGGTIIALRYASDGQLSALAIADANQEVGAAAAGGGGTGEIGVDLRPQRIGIVADGGLRWASPPELFVYEYDVLPAGGFVGTAATGDGNAHWWSARLYAFEAKSAAARLLYAPTDRRQQLSNPKVSPDGASVSFIGGLMSDFNAPGGDAFVVPLAGGLPTAVAPDLKATVTSLNWACAPGRLIAGLVAGAHTELAELDPATGSAHVLWSGQSTIAAGDGAVSFRCAVPTTATIQQSFTVAPEIVVGAAGAWHPLTHANEGITPPVRAIDVHWTNDGLAEQGWLLLPTAVPPGEKLPMITVAHGGPAWAQTPTFLGPGYNRALLDHGYALFLPNPRGSYGQGEAFTRANVGDFGGGDLRDILAGIDAAALVAPIDTARLGITGVSYGGFMTMWAVTQTHRFRAAVALAGISDWFSYYGENGIGDWLIPYFGSSPYDAPAAYTRPSPIGFVKNVQTPVLLMVGERDIECPPSQSREFWHALRELSVPTAYVVYPNEGHEISEPAHVADSEARAIAWFDGHMK